jgi:hypothetical protein
VARHQPESVTERLDRIASEIDTRLDAPARGATRKALRRLEWSSPKG